MEIAHLRAAGIIDRTRVGDDRHTRMVWTHRSRVEASSEVRASGECPDEFVCRQRKPQDGRKQRAGAFPQDDLPLTRKLQCRVTVAHLAVSRERAIRGQDELRRRLGLHSQGSILVIGAHPHAAPYRPAIRCAAHQH